MNPISEIFNLIIKHLPSVKGLLKNGLSQYLILQIVNLIIERITKKKPSTSCYKNILTDKSLLDKFVTNLVVIEESIKNKSKKEKNKPFYNPKKLGFLVFESWAILCGAFILLLVFVFILIKSPINKLLNTVMSFLICGMMMVIKVIVNHKFHGNTSDSSDIDIMLIEEIIKLQRSN